ncbi:zona pellucida sperm-binding protein 3 [Scophthalmus maximus]|uniref:zona pellucida sperm-binding protein 3 n=1 Tax=Scophthalmus maximus TaxID=52904 RepID=UPI001FA92EC5|nr:zona pellucida sperm-binding protein 3 [Scophthalmus maximus]
MKTKSEHVYMLWGVLWFGLLCCAVDTRGSALTRRKKLTLNTPKSRQIRLSTTVPSPTGSSPLSQLGPQRRHAPAPRSVRPAKIQSDVARLPDVSVTCSVSDLVVRVKPAFYGLGAEAQDLELGSGCRSNGVLRPYGDLLFTYPLTACGAVRQAPQGYLVYKFVLHYDPSPKRPQSRIDVAIECRYQRNHHVYQLAVKPTWQTAVMHKRLRGRPSDFKIELMDDSWNKPAKLQVYQLGQRVNVQVSAPHLPSGGKLYISSCYATPFSDSQTTIKYTLIDNFGCMMDSKRDPGASQFIYRTDRTLQFSLRAFQFTTDPDTEVSIHCKLSVTSEALSPAHKSCTYGGNRWKALTGDDSICACCDSQCVTSKPRRALMEGSASSASLLVSDQPYTAEDGFLPISHSLVSISREDKATVSRHIEELHSHDYLWEGADVVTYDEDYDEEDYAEEELEEDEREGSIIPGVTTEPELEKSIFRHGVLVEEAREAEVKKLNEPEVDGSAYEVEEDIFEGEEEEERFEGRVDEIADSEVIPTNQKDGEVLRDWARLEQLKIDLQSARVKPLDSDGEEEKRKYTDGGEEHERTRAYDVEWKKDDGVADVVDDGEMTWYFTWR